MLALGSTNVAGGVAPPAVAETMMTTTATTATTPRAVYFGNGCFWGRQHTFYEAEKTLGRTDDTITSVVGYAGGVGGSGSKDAVCYYYGAPETVYEKLGHCEVVAVDARNENELRVMADAYFGSFQRIPGLGMQRVDPQDAGPGYRNCIGLPGGIDSPLFQVVQEANVNNMKLVAGVGNSVKSRDKPTETDIINTVWVYDSDKLPFYPAEIYHQFHDGLGYKFPLEYTQGTKRNALERGLITTTGCPEMRERSFAVFDSTTA
jgi:peptide methionine sulfoxide reductase MsrA